MNTEEFYQEFSNLDLEIERLKNQSGNAKKELSKLENLVKEREFMQEVVRGLKSTSNQSDPGKYGPAFYFVKEILKNLQGTDETYDIIKGSEPSLYHACPKCGEEEAVLMSYEQTYDSPRGDAWKKEVFTLCQRDGKNVLKEVVKFHRF